jgi:hypothetical protein
MFGIGAEKTRLECLLRLEEGITFETPVEMREQLKIGCYFLD